jgi:hypothetical protein
MDTFLKIIDLIKNLMKDGKHTSIEFLIISVAFGLAIIPAINKLIKIISLNEFDRLFISKQDKTIQQLVVNLKDYLMFLSIYLLFGFYLLLLLRFDTFTQIITSFFSDIVLLLFLVTTLIIFLRIVSKKLFTVLKSFLSIKFKYDLRIKINLKLLKFLQHLSNLIFYFSVFSGIYVFSLLFAINLHEMGLKKIEYLVGLLFVPFIFLAIYRYDRKRKEYSYICTTTNEEEFNKSYMELKYTLENDKMIFVKSSDSSFNEVFMFDKTANRFFKFTKVEIL